MADINFTAGSEGLDFVSAVEAIIKRSCIIDYGIVQKVRDGVKGIVDVSLAVAKTRQDMTIMTCVLANIASSSFTVDIEPNVGDRVLVVYPRYYDEKMFTLSKVATKNTDIIVNERAKGYNLTTGIAILMNQYREDTHNNFLHVENGTVELKLAFKDDANLFNLTVSEDGEVTCSSNDITMTTNKDNEYTFTTGEEGVSLSINKDKEVNFTTGEDGTTVNLDKNNALSVTTGNTTWTSNDVSVSINADNEVTLSTGSSGTTVSINKNNELTIDTGKASVSIDKNGNVTIDATGKYKIKNGTTDLKAVIDGLATELENLTTVGSPATQATSPASKTTIGTWRTGKLSQLFT